LIPLLQPFYDYSWVVGVVVAFLLYWGLSKAFPVERAEPATAAPEPA
jgi:NCS1 family nucleobase:cation symporter-1